MSTKLSVAEYRKIYGKVQSKYGNKKTEYNGRVFDSKKEAKYAQRLEYLKHAHNPKDKVMQVEYQIPYAITAKNKIVAHYFADFRVTYGDKRQEVIDVKGVRTPVYILKKKLVEASHGIKIIEV